jgi:hypothetical protein
MDHFDSTMILWCFGAVQALGLASAWLSRVSEGSPLEPWFQRLFLLSLLASGVATIIAPGIGGVYWLISSATLGAMVVMAVCDFRQEQRPFTI